MSLVAGCLLVVLAASGATALPQGNQREGGPDSKNPVFNVWEYAFLTGRSGVAPAADPPTATTTENPNNNPCMWAIVSCCDYASQQERDNCFEVNGCSGAWFDDLCSQEFQEAVQNQLLSLFASK